MIRKDAVIATVLLIVVEYALIFVFTAGGFWALCWAFDWEFSWRIVIAACLLWPLLRGLFRGK